MIYGPLMFYKTHQRDLVRLLGPGLGMLPRFRVFESKAQTQSSETEDEPSTKRKKENGMKNGRKFIVDGKLEQKPTGF